MREGLEALSLLVDRWKCCLIGCVEAPTTSRDGSDTVVMFKTAKTRLNNTGFSAKSPRLESSESFERINFSPNDSSGINGESYQIVDIA